MEAASYNSALPEFVEETLTSVHSYANSSMDFQRKLKQNLEYNVTGRMVRPLLLIHAYRELTLNYNPRHLDESVNQVYRLAWMITLYETWCIVQDDILDDSEARRGKLSWWYKRNKNLRVALDADILREATYIFCNKYFSEHEHYWAIIKVLDKTLLMNTLGQYLDNLFSDTLVALPAREGRLREYEYHRDFYRRTATHKAGAWLYNTLSLAMLIAGKMNPQNKKNIWELSLEMGFHFQSINDMSDLTDGLKSGKIQEGNDIETGKITWPLVKALELANPEQRKTLELNYGQADPEKIDAVRKLFVELGLVEKYKEFETDHKNRTIGNILKRFEPPLDVVIHHHYKLLEGTYC